MYSGFVKMPGSIVSVPRSIWLTNLRRFLRRKPPKSPNGQCSKIAIISSVNWKNPMKKNKRKKDGCWIYVLEHFRWPRRTSWRYSNVVPSASKLSTQIQSIGNAKRKFLFHFLLLQRRSKRTSSVLNCLGFLTTTIDSCSFGKIPWAYASHTTPYSPPLKWSPNLIFSRGNSNLLLYGRWSTCSEKRISGEFPVFASLKLLHAITITCDCRWFLRIRRIQ